MTSRTKRVTLQTSPVPLVGDVARRAFDAAAAINAAGTQPAVDALIKPVIATLGFSHVILVETRDNVSRVLAGEPPSPWWPHMTAAGYAREDVVFKAAQTTQDAFFYSDVTEAPGLTDLQRRIAGERKEFGILDGFVSPSHGRNGAVSAVVLAGVDVDPRDPDVRAAALVLSDYYGVAARRLAPAPPAPAAVKLTRRQIDCLSWVRDGKSATDIGDILGISMHTVHEHVAEACARLGVRTRVQAVAAALALRLIDP
ncbi:MAG: autoinducer binding domain-containing protein [Hyphomonadaceae bacterium]|nr:autoinducer binding domain-containing protein [Hyphomonadaceae bacterium]